MTSTYQTLTEDQWITCILVRDPLSSITSQPSPPSCCIPPLNSFPCMRRSLTVTVWRPSDSRDRQTSETVRLWRPSDSGSEIPVLLVRPPVETRVLSLHGNTLEYSASKVVHTRNWTVRGHRAHHTSERRHNQDTFLPRHAWTDVSGSEDWLDDSRASCASPPDMMCTQYSNSVTHTSSSDVTVSPSSSQSYPQSTF